MSNEENDPMRQTMTVRIDRSASEQRLIDEKEAIAKQLEEANTKLKELETQNSELNQKVANQQPKAKGNVALDQNQANGGNIPKKGYDDYGSMMTDVYAGGNRELINQFWQKVLDATQQSAVNFATKSPDDKSLAEMGNEYLRAKLKAQRSD